MSITQDHLRRLFEKADIRIVPDGKSARTWDIQVHNPKFYRRVLFGGSMALGESYMDGWWDSEDVPGLFHKMIRSEAHIKIQSFNNKLWKMRSLARNLQSITRAFQVGERHYDIGNDLFEHMLDKRMVYSCAYWNDAKNIDQAQEAKLDLLCRKLRLKPGLRLLDIGSGWGSLMKFAAEKYGIEGVGVTVSKEQVNYAKKSCKGLPVEFRLQDYRKVEGRFDRVVSVGMIEHVGRKNYATFMEKVDEVMKDNGIFVLHTISRTRIGDYTEPWVCTYIFPNGELPSVQEIVESGEKHFVLEDWQNIGLNYVKTLQAWHERFQEAWPRLSQTNPKYDERFRRMWSYYLKFSEATFACRASDVTHYVFTKRGLLEEYPTIR